MVLEGNTKISNYKYKRNDKEYNRYLIYIPKYLFLDSAFPFTQDDDLTIRIEKKRLIIEKSE